MSIFKRVPQAKKFKDINNKELKEMLQSPSLYHFVDVRTELEYNDAHIKGFDIWVDYYLFKENLSLVENLHLDPSKPVVITCRSGVRSIDASNIFYDLGFMEVYNLKRGIIGWRGETE